MPSSHNLLHFCAYLPPPFSSIVLILVSPPTTLYKIIYINKLKLLFFYDNNKLNLNSIVTIKKIQQKKSSNFKSKNFIVVIAFADKRNVSNNGIS
jgi:hypothetical protein